MRQYLFILFILASSLVACEPSDVNETSAENRVNTFTFYEDTLNPGLTEAIYKIDHRGKLDTGLIYCKDSLKFGTRLDSVVPDIKYKATPGSATFYLPNDTIISTGYDTLDLTQKPIYLQVLASDMTSEKWYRIEVHAHQINPDLYVWEKLVDNIFPQQKCETKAFYINDQFVLFVNNGLSTQIYTSHNASDWTLSNQTLNGLPTPCHVRDIVLHDNQLYYIDKDKLYASANIYNWTETDYSTAAFEPINMLLPYNGLAWCVTQERSTGKLQLATIQNNQITLQTNIEDYENGYIPNTFPISDFAATAFESSSERPRAMIVGGRNINGNPVNSRWNIEYDPNHKNYRMENFTISQPTFDSLTGASIIQYNGQLMMFGGLDNDLEWNSNILYSDDEGMHWYVPDTACNQLPMECRQNQSVIVNQKSIYLIGGQSNTDSFSDVYRGRLNSLQ